MSGPPAPQQPQPVSFKTVPGRNKTQKWQQAKTYNYDGDEWGGYDPYDEYGDYDEAAPPEAPQPSYAKPQRQNSFDAGDEKRTFSSGYGADGRAVSPAAVSSGSRGRPSGDHGTQAAAAVAAAGSSGRESNDYATSPRGRNFTNPEQVPPPLSMRASPTRSAGGTAFPPRKSSISQASSSPTEERTSASAKNADKPLPFVRPSDIYRRMAEEKDRERQSSESGRPSMDSMQRDVAASSPTRARDIQTSASLARTTSLDPVAEQRERDHAQQVPQYIERSPDRGVSSDMQQEAAYQPLSSLQANTFGASSSVAKQDLSPVLPPVSRFSGFGTDFLHGVTARGSTPDASTTESSPPSSPVHQHVQSTLARVFNAPLENADPSHVLPTMSTFQANPTATRALYGQDPAADVLAERQYGTPMEATRAPQGRDPAAEILAERQHAAPTQATRAPEGYDPAAEILAERQHGTPMQATRAAEGYDPAGDILAERQHAIPIHAVGRQDRAPDLQHQPSSGFRSVVHTAFERPDDNSIPPTPVSRDGSQSLGSDSGVSRSDTNSTSGISPIMSRVPSAATAQHRQQERDAQVPPIAEEPGSARTPTQSRPPSGNYLAGSPPQHQIPRKASPGHSRNVSSESGSTAGFQRGYRRSLDPPSHDNSPARTPGLEDGSGRRVSTPMAAETFESAEAPDVEDQAAEMPRANLEPADTPASEIGELAALAPQSDYSALPTTGRGRSGTGYSVREADLAHEVNLSPASPSYSPPVADDQRAMQQLFLRTHNSTTPSSPGSPGFNRPVSPGLAAQGLGIARASTPNGSATGRDSPAKGRVREIAEKYTSLDDASRRNSAASFGSGKSSWSNFRGGSDENLALRRKGTGTSLLAGERMDGARDEGEYEEDGEEHEGMFPQYEQSRDRSNERSLSVPVAGSGEGLRPGAQSQASFRPHLPGEWVSYAPTPAGEEPPAAISSFEEREPQMQTRGVEPQEVSSPTMTPRASHIVAEHDEPVDLTPTTKKHRLPSGDFTPDPKQSTSTLTQHVKDAGAALGASLMAMGGLQSHARDFASAEPAKPVDQPEMAAKVPYGNVSSYLRPGLRPREESGATDVTEMSAPVSVASEAPPTPPAKNTPGGPSHHLAVAGGDGGGSDELEAGPGGRPISSYFSGVVAPLRMGHSREASAEPAGQREMGRPRVLPSLSTDTGAGDLESDRLRKEIVRSLGANPLQRESIMEDEERTPEALDALGSERGVEGAGRQALDKPMAPRMLDQRFSWENRPQQAGVLTPPRIREPDSPEVKPEAPYERPRSKGLHIVNPGVGEEAETPADDETPAEALPLPPAVLEPSGVEKGLAGNLSASAPGFVSPMTHSQENLALPSLAERFAAAGGEEGEMREMGPSPISDRHDEDESGGDSEPRLPLHYQSDAAEGRSGTPPQPSENRVESQPTSPAGAKRQSAGQSTGQRFTPMRQIMAIKSSPERIQSYNDTRQQFADTDTGLSNWLSGMLVQRPDLANLSTPGMYRAPAALGPSGTFSGRHKHSPSIVTKFYGGDRKASVSGAGAASAGGGDAAGDAGMPPRTPGRDRVGGEGIDMDKVQQRGKELMKGASVLGGKAQAGAKGLFAKGKSRWGVRHSGGDGKSTNRSKSRPSSLVLTNPDLIGDADDDNDFLPATAGAASIGAAGGRTSGPLTSARTEAWNEPDAALPRTPDPDQERSGTPARLGVLPSPGVETSSYWGQSPWPGPSRDGTVMEEVGEGFEDVEQPYERLQSTGGSSYAQGGVKSAALESLGDTGKGTADGAEKPEQYLAAGTSAIDANRDAEAGATDGLRHPERLQATAMTSYAHDPSASAGMVARQELESVAAADEAEMPHQQQLTASYDQVEQNPGASPSAEPLTPRPQQQRKVSALASLPSQQRNVSRASSMVSSRPTTSTLPKVSAFPTQLMDGNKDDALYATTPTVASPRSLALGRVPDDDDEMYDSTPVVTRAPAPWHTSPGAPDVLKATVVGKPGAVSGAEDEQQPARSTNAGDWDERSEVSAEEHLQHPAEDKGPEDYGSMTSRHSSVSSLGSPDTVVGNRASMIRMRPSESHVPDVAGEQPAMTAQAVPAGPTGPSLPSAGLGAPASESSERQMTPSAAQQAMRSSERSFPAHAESPDQGRFMNRSYYGRIAPAERAMSYMPLGGGLSGAPNQEEAISTGEEPPAELVDISRFGGPPAGTAPFQQHPLYRKSGIAAPPSVYENLRSSRSGTATPTMMHSRQVSGISALSSDVGDRASKRVSGFFRGPDSAPDDTTTGAPPPNAMTPRYGLAGLDMTDAEATSAAPLRQNDDKQKKRRSGMWDAFKRSPSISRTNFSRESSIGRLDSRTDLVTNPAMVAASRARENTTKPKTLQKPQRAVSAATPPTDLKKKPRFSRLGSLFGRSNTQGHNAEKPNKLVKTQPPGREQSQRQAPVPSGSVRGYDAYEAMRRQQPTDVPRGDTDGRYADTTTNSPYQQVPPGRMNSPGGALPRPPSQGWYGPGENQSPDEQMQPAQETDSFQQSQRSPQFRRLHSQGFQRGLEEAGIPEAFRPTEASYGKASAPIGPPPEHQSPIVYEQPAPSRMPTLPTRQPYWNRQLSGSSQMSSTVPPQQRPVTSGSAGYQPSPPVQDQSEPQRALRSREGWLPSMPTVQPNMAPPRYPPGGEQNVEMVEEGTPHSPARAYADQQTPWSIGMPSGGGGSQGSSRVPSWTMPAGGPPPPHGDVYAISQSYQGSMSPPPGAVRHSPYGLPMSPQSPDAQQPYVYPPPQAPASMMFQGPLYAGSQARDMTNPKSGSYPSPPHTPQSPTQHYQSPYGQPAQSSYGPPTYPQQRPPPQKQRYYAQQPPQPPQPTSRLSSAGRPLTYQRTPSGFTGRRDDAAVSEQELMMRGASYPGQEWSPAI
ncbi:hypothetical protein LTR36_010264 [Oleoguttula mirabilis]|uniref:Uncharacterized protein n=1 Tax=Oleoguttula mirabilis TaxID=1507867 RepID=A0AAV9J5B6_9PEZI|nr:hypothetical protein LTR36_010264 [Oleoguttula mirabilis]